MEGRSPFPEQPWRSWVRELDDDAQGRRQSFLVFGKAASRWKPSSRLLKANGIEAKTFLRSRNALMSSYPEGKEKNPARDSCGRRPPPT